MIKMDPMEQQHGTDRVNTSVPIQLPGSDRVVVTLVTSEDDARVIREEWTEDQVREHLGSFGLLYQDALRIESRRPRG